MKHITFGRTAERKTTMTKKQIFQQYVWKNLRGGLNARVVAHNWLTRYPEDEEMVGLFLTQYDRQKTEKYMMTQKQKETR